MNETFVQRVSTFVVVVCLIVLAGTAALVISPTLRQWVGVGPGAQPPAYAVGDRVDIEASVYQSAPVTLIVFARSNCPSCQRTAPFYAQVVAAGKTHGIPTALMTPIADLDTERAYAASLGIDGSQVYTVDPGSIKLRAVPALMVVESSGQIRHVWVGAPDDTARAAILSSVNALPVAAGLQ